MKRYAKYKVVFFPALMFTFILAWADARGGVDYDGNFYRRPDGLFVISPVALMKSEGFLINYLLTFIFIAALTVLAVWLWRRRWRLTKRAPCLWETNRRSLYTGFMVLLLPFFVVIPALHVFFFSEYAILLILPCAVHLYLCCAFFTNGQPAQAQRKAQLYSFATAAAGCLGALIALWAVLLIFFGITYRANTWLLVYEFYMGTMLSILLLAGYAVFQILKRIKRKWLEVALQLLFCLVAGAILLYLEVMGLFAFNFGRNDWLVVPQGSSPYVFTISSGFWGFPTYAERQHISTFFMGADKVRGIDIPPG